MTFTVNSHYDNPLVVRVTANMFYSLVFLTCERHIRVPIHLCFSWHTRRRRACYIRRDVTGFFFFETSFINRVKNVVEDITSFFFLVGSPKEITPNISVR